MPLTQMDASERTFAPTGIGWRHPHYAELLARRPQLDFVEVHSENFFGAGGAALSVLERGREHYPVSLHGVGLSLGSASGLDHWHLERLSALVQRIEPVRVSDHACFARGSLQGRTVHAGDLLPLPFSREALQTLCDNVEQVQMVLGRPFMVENLSAYLAWNVPAQESAGAEAEFLSALARRTGCQLLVDVNNIYVNALNVARDQTHPADPVQACRQWLEAIDPRHVGELHLAGHCHVPGADGDASSGIVIDDHGSRVCEPVWGLYQHAIGLYGAVPTLLEWDTDIPALDVLLDEAARARSRSATALLESVQ